MSHIYLTSYSCESDLTPRSPSQVWGRFSGLSRSVSGFQPCSVLNGRAEVKGRGSGPLAFGLQGTLRVLRVPGLGGRGGVGFSQPEPVHLSKRGHRICPRAAAYTSPFSHYVRAFVACDAPPGRDRMSMFRLCTPARKLHPPT